MKPEQLSRNTDGMYARIILPTNLGIFSRTYFVPRLHNKPRVIWQHLSKQPKPANAQVIYNNLHLQSPTILWTNMKTQCLRLCIPYPLYRIPSSPQYTHRYKQNPSKNIELRGFSFPEREELYYWYLWLKSWKSGWRVAPLLSPSTKWITPSFTYHITLPHTIYKLISIGSLYTHTETTLLPKTQCQEDFPTRHLLPRLYHKYINISPHFSCVRFSGFSIR